jgi:X-Pro dipeptidyl-peptidase
MAVAVAAFVALAGGSTARADVPHIVIGPDGTTADVFSYADAIRERVFVPIQGRQDGDGVTDQMSIDIVRPAETDARLKVPAIIDPSPYYTSVGRQRDRYIHTTAAGVADKFRSSTTTTSSRAASSPPTRTGRPSRPAARCTARRATSPASRP